MSLRRRNALRGLIAGLTFTVAGAVFPVSEVQGQEPPRRGGTCDLWDLPGAVWWAPASEVTTFTVAELAAYLGPVIWFSPDEPNLRRRKGVDIRVPEALPFEDAAPDNPVLYYQLDQLVHLPGASTFVENEVDPSLSTFNPQVAAAFTMGFFAYYATEEGLGSHDHDLEAIEFRGGFANTSGEFITDRAEEPLNCDQDYTVLMVTQVTGKAHGIVWFWNVLDVDAETYFPFHAMVEEGKHAFGTDKNADGQYTPGYDVTRRINDAWGTRDVIRTGALGSGGYRAYMTKNRINNTKVYPPLPPDSPLRDLPWVDSVYTADQNAVYELRVLPPASLGEYDEHLYRFMESKEVEGWPKMRQASDLQGFMDVLDEGSIVKSLSIAARYDGDLGLGFVFPLFIVKNFEDPIGGGFIVHRMWLKDKGFRDFGWQLMYTPSASRWFDTYAGMGVEWDAYDEIVRPDDPDPTPLPGVDGPVDEFDVREVVRTDFVYEAGIKFRVNLSTSPLRFLGFLTDFWGLRFGIKNSGFSDIERLTYVLEFGAGVW